MRIDQRRSDQELSVPIRAALADPAESAAAISLDKLRGLSHPSPTRAGEPDGGVRSWLGTFSVNIL